MKIFCFIALALCAVGTSQAAAPAVTITANPATGTAPYTTTLTWSSTGAVSCAASGLWTGTKAVSGTATTTVSAAGGFGLTCVAADGIATLNWVAPTQNTDNSPLTNLTGFKAFRGATPTAVLATNTTIGTTGPGVTTFADSGLTTGSYSYAVTAVSSTGESDKSNVSTVNVVASSATASAAVAINTKPNPPTNLTATVALAINIPLDSGDGFQRTVAYTITGNGPGVLAGFVKIGTPVTSQAIFTYRNQPYCQFREKHPNGASNIAWDKGVVQDISKVAAPCG